MSKIGQKKIIIPEGVKIEEEKGKIKIRGPKGALNLEIFGPVTIAQNDSSLAVLRANDSKKAKSLHGLYRQLIANMVTGVTEGFTKKLDFKGVGFRAEVRENKLVLNVGFSHPVEYLVPKDIEIDVQKNIITVSGISCQQVGQVAAEIRAIRPVEPYKGKGIKYLDEIPRRKPGKAAKAAIGETK